MKKYIILAVSFVLVFFIGFAVANVNKNDSEKFSFGLNTESDNAGDYKNIGNYKNNNYIYAAASNLAFNEFKSSFVKEDVKLKNLDKKGENMLKSFNSSFFTTNDIDSSDYYIKSGYGQSTVDTVNKESREKFPNKTFEDLDLKLTDKDFLSYAYLYKKMSFAKKFTTCENKFKNTVVNGFCGGYEENMNVVKYFNKNKFIVRLKDSKNNDEIYLMKGYDSKNPDLAVSDMKKYSNDTENLEEGFVFFAPNLSIKNYNRHYSELENKNILNENLLNYNLSVFFENLNFDLDNTGATVENEAVIVSRFTSSSDSNEQKPKELYFDNDFFVVAKQKNSQNPYLVLGITNTDFMSKK